MYHIRNIEDKIWHSQPKLVSRSTKSLVAQLAPLGVSKEDTKGLNPLFPNY